MIARRLVTGINSRPTVCIVCLGSVHFIQQAAKCQGTIMSLVYIVYMTDNVITDCWLGGVIRQMSSGEVQ